MVSKILFILVCCSLFLNQAGRITLGNNIALTPIDISTGVFCIYFIVRLLKSKKTVTYESFTKYFLIFIVVCLLSLLFNVSKYTSFQLFVSFLYILRFFMYGLFYIAVRSLLKDKKEFVQKSLLITGVGLLIAGGIQYIFYNNLRNLYYLGWDDHANRLFSTFFDPNFAGAFFVLFFFFLLGLSEQIKQKTKQHTGVIILLLITLIEIFLSFSRSALLILLVSSFVYFYLRKKLRYFFATIAILLVIFLLVAPKMSVENTNYFRTASTDARVGTASIAWNIFFKNPMFGSGFDAYRYAQLDYHVTSLKGTALSNADAGSDNSFLFVLATTGVLGFISYIFFQWKLVKFLWYEKKDNIWSTVLFVSLIGIFVDSLFINSLFYPSILVWFVSLLAIRDYR